MNFIIRDKDDMVGTLWNHRMGDKLGIELNLSNILSVNSVALKDKSVLSFSIENNQCFHYPFEWMDIVKFDFKKCDVSPFEGDSL